MNHLQEKLARALVNLDAWLETMRQPGGYGGPVAHHWQNRYRFTGPGLDWRYEGILMGYSSLAQKTHALRWQCRLRRAASDLLNGQREDGSYLASCFERNPGSLGTPHEAAATLGLLTALPHLAATAPVLAAARRNLDNLLAQLWDGAGFNDRPGIPGRVPNKLATLAHALMTFTQATGDPRYLPYARRALEGVLHFQVGGGPYDGAVHQYAPASGLGDGRFFPFYAARCVPPLLLGATLFGEPRYRHAAERIVDFLQLAVSSEASWPQIVYANGRCAQWPQWLAGSADILLAYHALGAPLPVAALEHLLSSQLRSGGFPTAQGFASQINQRQPGQRPDYRDVTPVVGWNDKVLRLLALLLEPETPLPEAQIDAATVPVTVWGQQATFDEDAEMMRLLSRRGQALYAWTKAYPWAYTVAPAVEIR